MHPVARFTVALYVFCATSVGQQPERSRPTAGTFGSALGVFRCEDQWVGLGPNYKAYFTEGEVEFVPGFGRAAANNHPLRVRATGMSRDGAEVLFAAAAPILDGEATVRFTRAPGVSEVYTTRDDGLEQSFVLAERPAGHGDLVVSCTLQCEVAGMVTDTGGARFELPGIGAITMGTVTGVDARGQRVHGGLHLDGNTLSLSLPAYFVDHAAYPLELDPLLGSATLLSGLDRQDPDVVYDPATGDWLAVWATYVSASDADLYAQRISHTTGSPVGSVFAVDVTAGSTEFPRVASVRVTGRVLVVYQQVVGSPLPSLGVIGRTIDVAARTVSPAATIGFGTHYSVASEETTVDNEAIVVWGTAADTVQAAQVTVTATGAPQPVAPVTLATGTNDPICVISRTSGGTGNYLVAWRPTPILPLPGGSAPLLGCVVSRNLSILTPVRTLVTAMVGVPSVDASGSRFLIAYSKWETGSTTDRDIFCVSAAYLSAFSNLIVVDGPSPIEATANQDETLPDVAWLGPRFCVTFHENPGLSTENVAAWLVNPDCTTCSVRMALLGVNLNSGYIQERTPRIASRAPWLVGVDDGEIVFVEDNPTTPHSVVVGQRIEAIGAGGAITNLGGSCGVGGVAGSSGGLALGDNAFTFSVTGLPPGAVTFLSIAFPAPTLSCGTCTLINPISFDFKVSSGGSASSNFTVPCSTQYLGVLIQTQWVSFFTSSTACPLASGLSASNRIQFTIGT